MWLKHDVCPAYNALIACNILNKMISLDWAWCKNSL